MNIHKISVPNESKPHGFSNDNDLRPWSSESSLKETKLLIEAKKKNRTNQSVKSVIDPEYFFHQLFTNDYKEFKQFADTCDSYLLKNLFISSAKFGIIRNIEYLIPTIKTNDMIDALNQAFATSAKYGHCRVMLYLLDNGANIKFENFMALQYAVSEGHEDIVDELIKKGADVNIDGGRLLFDCCMFDDNFDVLTLLLMNNINVLEYYQQTINICLTKNHTKCTDLLVKYSIKHFEPAKKNAFMYADDDNIFEENSDPDCELVNFSSDPIPDPVSDLDIN